MRHNDSEAELRQLEPREGHDVVRGTVMVRVATVVPEEANRKVRERALRFAVMRDDGSNPRTRSRVADVAVTETF